MSGGEREKDMGKLKLAKLKEKQNLVACSPSYNYHHVDIFHNCILTYKCDVKFKIDLNVAEQNIHLPSSNCRLLSCPHLNPCT